MAAPNLRIQKLAEPVERHRVIHPLTGDAVLLTTEDADKLQEALAPVLPLFVHTPRPFAGIRMLDVPDATRIPVKTVARGRSEGWITVEGEEIIHRSVGPREDPWGVPSHAFVHLTHLTFKTVDGDVRYRVTENPDKWPEEKDGKAGFGGEVRWEYGVEREDG